MFTGWKGRTKQPGSNNANSTLQDPFVPANVNTPGPNIGVPTTSTSNLNANNNAVVNSFNPFGAPINPSSEGPPILGKLVRFLQTKAINSENLFTTATPDLENEVQVMKKNMLRDMEKIGGDNDSIQLTTYTKEPLVIAELLKQFLASLPEPLLTYQLYDSFLLTQTIQAPSDRIWAFRFLLAYLPPGFRASVKLLLTLLFSLSRNSEINKMDATYLAQVFGYYLLRPEEELYYMHDDSALIIEIVGLLIHDYESVLRAAPVGASRSATNLLAQVSVSSLPSAQAPASTPAPAPAPAASTTSTSTPLPPHPLDQSYSQEHPLSRAAPDHPQRKTTTQDRPTLASPSRTTPPTLEHPLAQAKNPAHPPPNRPTPPAPLQKPTSPTGGAQNPPPPVSRPPVNRGNGAVSQPPPVPAKEEPTKEEEEEVDPETAAKLGKLRDSVLNLLDDNIYSSVMALLSSLMLSSTVGEIIELSKALRDTKKSLSDHVLQSVKADKQVIATFLSTNPKPPIEVPPSVPSEDARINELRSATVSATDQILELLFFLRYKMAGMTHAGDLADAIAIGQIAKTLKNSLGDYLQRLHIPTPTSPPRSITSPLSPLSTLPPSSPFNSQPSSPYAMSPPQSPAFSRPSPAPSPRGPTVPPVRRPPSVGSPTVGSPSVSPTAGSVPPDPTAKLQQQIKSPVRPVANSRDACISSMTEEVGNAKRYLDNMAAQVPTCGQAELVEYAKGVKYVKGMAIEQVTELSLNLETDTRVESIEGEDQLSALRRAVLANIEKITEILDAMTGYVTSPTGQFMDPRPVADKIVVMSRALSHTVK